MILHEIRHKFETIIDEFKNKPDIFAISDVLFVSICSEYFFHVNIRERIVVEMVYLPGVIKHNNCRHCGGHLESSFCCEMANAESNPTEFP